MQSLKFGEKTSQQDVWSSTLNEWVWYKLSGTSFFLHVVDKENSNPRKRLRLDVADESKPAASQSSPHSNTKPPPFIDYGDGFLMDTNVFPVDDTVEGFFVDASCFYVNPTGSKRRRLECPNFTVVVEEEMDLSRQTEVVEIEVQQEVNGGPPIPFSEQVSNDLIRVRG